MTDEISTTTGEVNAQAQALAPAPAALAPTAPAAPPAQSVVIEKTFVKGSLMDANRLTIWGLSVPKGKTEVLASIEGTVTGIIRREPTDIDKKAGLDENICLEGFFTIDNWITGESSEAKILFLPRHYMDKIDEALTGDTTSVGIDCELAVKATGKQISYTWVVIEWDTSGRHAALRRKHALRRQARAESGMVFKAPELTPAALATLAARALPQVPVAAPAPAIVDATAKPAGTGKAA